MPIIVSGGSSRSAGEGIIADIHDNWESWNVLASVGLVTTPRTSIRFGFASPSLDTSPWINAAGITLLNQNVVGGPMYLSHVSQAAGAYRAMQGPGTAYWMMPFRRWGEVGVGGIPGTLYVRPFWRFQIDFLLRLPGARGPAIIECGECFSPATNGALNSSNTAGVGWTSDPAVNAGRWTAQRKLTQFAGFATSLFDSGVSPGTDWVKLSIAYEEHGDNPRIIWLLNDTPQHEVAGPLNMPIVAAPAEFGPYIGCGPGVGTTFHDGPARFRITEL